MWLNSAALLVSRAPLGADENFSTTLNKGWNEVLVKVVNPDKPASLGVRVAGEGLRTAGSPSELPIANGGGR